MPPCLPRGTLSSVDLSYVTARLLILIIAVVCPMISEAGPAMPTPVVVLANGDDGLTVRLSDAIERALRSSAGFLLNPRPVPPGTLVVRIPTNVPWERIGDRIKALYTEI